jgi:hypothetical protein
VADVEIDEDEGALVRSLVEGSWEYSIEVEWISEECSSEEEEDSLGEGSPKEEEEVEEEEGSSYKEVDVDEAVVEEEEGSFE